ncbi:MAG: PEP/pyruvate-binding domain-containing protein [Candidatus Staskawiczbacteria bacterium]|jgi:hypothetical protein
MQNGKAENLAILAKIRGINVPRFTVLHPTMSECETVEAINSFLGEMPNGSTVAVRSSAAQEDSANASFAGMYATKLRVPATVHDVRVAVDEISASGTGKEEVISHYAANRSIELVDSGVSVVVQEMVEADMSGVVFSHSLAEPDGYYVVSVSSGTGETIVGGASNGKLIRIVRGVNPEDLKDAWLQHLVGAMMAIEQHFQSASLDVEFAFRRGTLYILQCRPITTVQTAAVGIEQGKKILRRIESLNSSVTVDFSGDVLGDMIDINPRELLGASPTLLDISIFRHLFADRIVEQVRRDMGYDPLGIGLIRVVAGKPYASMRATAFSFRPCGIPDRIYERIVGVYRDKLIKNPSLQSRVEFDLYAMSVGDKLERIMAEARLDDCDKDVVRDAFVRIDSVFRNVSESYSGTFEADVQDYEQRTASLGDAPLNTILEHVATGTEMFVRMARLAFYWKNKFEEMHPRESLNDLIAGHIHSVNGQMRADLVACRNGVITRDTLVQRYGHLCPGQFSVFGEFYADDPDNYLFAQMERAEVVKLEKRPHTFEDTAEFKNVITFMQAREQMKFLFAQSLHLFATKLKRQLAQRGISRQDASCLSWEELNVRLVGSSNLKASREDDFPPVLLPDVIIPGLTDLRVITFAEANPSYITKSVVKARVCVLEHQRVKTDVKNALVLLPNADPGYDFLFHSGAAGIITKVGGPASHMCIRAIELQMPACIGCGESMYQMLASAHGAILDCVSRQIVVLD